MKKKNENYMEKIASGGVVVFLDKDRNYKEGERVEKEEENLGPKIDGFPQKMKKNTKKIRFFRFGGGSPLRGGRGGGHPLLLAGGGGNSV